MRAYVPSRHLSPQSRSCIQSYSCSCYYKDSWNHQSFYFLVCFALTIPSTLLQAKSHKVFVHRQSTSQCMRNTLNDVPSPGHVRLEAVPISSVSLALHIPMHYIDLVGYRPGQRQELLLGTLFHVSLHFAISKMLWDAMILTQPQPNQKDRLTASFPFWESSHHTDTTSNFGSEVNILSKCKETGRERYKLQMHHLSQIKSHHGASKSFIE